MHLPTKGVPLRGALPVRFPDFLQPLQRGHVAVVRGRPREAVEHYREAGTLAPDRPLPFVRMGEVLLQMEQPREAVRAFDEALARAPSDTVALRGKAAALAAEGKPAEARAIAARAVELEAMERAGRSVRGPADSRLAEIEGSGEGAAKASSARLQVDLEDASGTLRRAVKRGDAVVVRLAIGRGASVEERDGRAARRHP